MKYVGLMWLVCLSVGCAEPATETSETVDAVASEDDAASSDADEDTTSTDASDAAVDPTSYQVALLGWDVAPGEEVTRCSVHDVGNAAEVFVSAIQTTLAPGSHHLIVYKTKEPVSAAPFECQPFTDTLTSQPLMISEIGEERLELPAGVALPLAAGQRVMVEAHYLNYFPETIVAGATVKFETMPAESVEHTAGIALLGTSNFQAMPGVESVSDWTWVDMPNGTKVYALAGHTHQWGTKVEIERSTGANTTGDPVYPPEGVPFVWNEAPVAQFSPSLEFASGAGLRFRCTWKNTGTAPVGFGLSANDEMCLLWAYHYPSSNYQFCGKGVFPWCPDDNGPDGQPNGPTDATVSITVGDGSDGAPIAGATVQLGDADGTSDASGLVGLPVLPLKPFKVAAQSDGYLDSLHFGIAPPSDFPLTVSLARPDVLTGFLGPLGKEVDTAKGFLFVAVVGQGPGKSVGSRVDINTPFGVAFVKNADGDREEGQVLLEGGNNWVIFGNVDPGEMTVTVTPPDDSLVCVALPYGKAKEPLTVTVQASANTFASFLCRAPVSGE